MLKFEDLRISMIKVYGVFLSFGVKTPYSLLLFFYLLVLSASNGMSAMTKMQGYIVGANFVNVRSGPSISFPSIAILKTNEKITVERLEGRWYRVSLADERKGYVYEEFLRFPDSKQLEPFPVLPVTKVLSKSTDGLTSDGFGGLKEPFPKTRSQLKTHNLPPKKLKDLKTQASLPVQLDRNPIFEIIRWLGAALFVFFLGWILGGNYYMRRKKSRRIKLRF